MSDFTLDVLHKETLLNKIQHLTDTEQVDLKRRGFFVQTLIWSVDIFTTTPILLVCHFASLLIMLLPMYILVYIFSIQHLAIYAFISQSFFLYCLSRFFMTYVFQWKRFWHIDETGEMKSLKKERWWVFLLLFYDWVGLYRWEKIENIIFAILIHFITIWMLIGMFTFFEEQFATFNFHPYDDYLYPMIAVFIGFYIVGYIARLLVEHFHPLYIFDNLWEKIQKLTPNIEEQSKKIQSEFESTMDFSVLSHGFDLLSRNFSKIVEFIIKLEKAEKRANKWNLFDSEKYINSLRSDIVTPLISLKTFLEEKKIELIQSKQELTRVQVWWSEETGNIELQAKRSDPLILELTANIEKLDVMIEKMG